MLNMKTVLVVLMSFIFSLLTGQEQENFTSLPLRGDLGVHDPVMVKHENNYYVFATGQGVSIKQSPDKIHWKNIGSVFSKEELPNWHTDDIPEQEGHLWAPDIHYRDGKYHLYYSVSAWMNFNSSIGYATNVTLDPEDENYEWVDHGQVISYKNGGEGVNVIDPNVFVSEDGRVWLFYGSYKAGLRIAELNPETGMLLNDTPELVTLTPSMGEGVFVLKGPEYYYIFASRGRCCSGLESTYHVIMGRSKKLEGPYLTKTGESWLDDKASLLLEGNHEEPGRGHNGFFVENGTTYIVYHAYTRSAEGKSLLNIAVLYADEDGWPTLTPTDQRFNTAGFQEKVFHGHHNE